MSKLRYTYKTVFIQQKGSLPPEDSTVYAFAELDKIINSMAEEGWEFIQSLPVPPTVYALFILVFRRSASEE